MDARIHIDAPYIPAKEYAKRTGQSVKSVTNQVRAGKLPVRPRDSGKGIILINIALLTKEALEAKF